MIKTFLSKKTPVLFFNPVLRVVLCLACAMTCHWQLEAQDSTEKKSRWRNFDFDITGANYYQDLLYPGVQMPKEIRERRLNQVNSSNWGWQYTTDNPMYHGAYFIAANAKYKVSQGVTLYSSLVGEHRGASYGVNNSASIIVFPQMSLALDQPFRLLGQDFRAYGSIGNQQNPRVYEGLTLYNLYQHGTDLNLSWKKFHLHYFQISDLSLGLGLDIGDSYDTYGSFEGLKLEKKEDAWLADVRFGYSYFPIGSTTQLEMDRYIYNLSAGIYKTADFRIYAQTGVRPFGTATSTNLDVNSGNIGGLLGLKWHTQSKRSKTELRAEARYYGSGFNRGFRDTQVKYRKSGNASPYANTIGDQFYPLLLYERPFSQWAVFTEYQGDDVAGLSCTINNSFYLYKKIALRTELDLNYIQALGKSGFLYPFGSIGLGWESGQNSAFLSLSNKGMNLDTYYPTFYLYTIPCLMVSIKRNISDKWRDKGDCRHLTP